MSEARWPIPAAAAFAALMGLLWAWALRSPPEPPPRVATREPATPAPTVPRSQSPERPPAAAPTVARPDPGPPKEPGPEFPDPPAQVTVTGRVRDAAGAPVPRALVWARWEGGEGRWFGKEDGSFRFSVLARDLTVVAERRDGLLGARSDEVAVAGNDGGEWTLDLVVPIERKAGLGIGIGPVPGGMGVRMVHPGTPADRAGLEVGDVIVSVDGVDADGMTAEDFVGRMTGPEGSFVRFAVRSPEGVEEELRLRREFLEPTGPR